MTPPGDIASEIPAGTGGFLNPRRVLERLDIHRGMILADFGAGSGYFAIPAGRLVGERGKIYAIEIQKNSMDLIRSRALLEHLLQVEPIWGDLEHDHGSHLRDNTVDLVIAANILFQSHDKKQVLEEAKRVLKAEGRVAVLEWNSLSFPAGPPVEQRVKKEVVKDLASDIGLVFEKEFDAGNNHYGLLFKKA